MSQNERLIVITVILIGVFDYNLGLLCNASSWPNYNSNSSLFDKSPLASDHCHGCFLAELRSLVESGELSLARRKALNELGYASHDRCKKSDISKTYVDAFQQSYDEGGTNYLQKIKNTSVKNEEILQAKKDNPNCTEEIFDWNIVNPNDIWDELCSVLPTEKKQTKNHLKKEFPLKTSPAWLDPLQKFSVRTDCCEFSPGSWTYLRLPVVHEPIIRLRIPYHSPQQQQSLNIHDSSVSLDLEQDGYLRPFDVSGILWPAGYMLSLCFGDLSGCPIPELHTLILQYQQSFFSKNNRSYPPLSTLALELGAGVGASSIALAKSLQRMGFPSLSFEHREKQPWVVATDVAPHALALITANANNNQVDDIIDTRIMDHFNQTSIQEVKKTIFPSRITETRKAYLSYNTQEQTRPQNDGFAMIFGSSLQGLFEDTDRPESVLWRTLDELLDRNNKNSLVILGHSRAEPLKIPPDPNFSYRLVRRLSASDAFFGHMKTRAGDKSDFEICVFQPQTSTNHNKFTSSSFTNKKDSNNEL